MVAYQSVNARAMIIPLVQPNHTRLFYTRETYRIREYTDGTTVTWVLERKGWKPNFRIRCRTVNLQNRIRQLIKADE